MWNPGAGVECTDSKSPRGGRCLIAFLSVAFAGRGPVSLRNLPVAAALSERDCTTGKIKWFGSAGRRAHGARPGSARAGGALRTR